MKRRFLAIALITGLLAGVISGCGNTKSTGETTVATENTQQSGETEAAKQEGSTETKTIRFLHKWPEEERMSYFQEIIDAYEAEHPDIKIEMSAYGDDAIKDKLRVMVGGSEVPDIFFSWSSEFANNFIKENTVLDLTSYFEADQEWADSFNQSMLQCAVFDGKNYGVPFDYVTKHFVYNEAVFQENNIEIPETWDELLDVCETLKQAGITPIALGNQSPWVVAHFITTLNQKLVPADTIKANYSLEDPDFSDEGYQKALAMMAELLDKEYVNTDVNSATWEMSQGMVCEGQAAMIYEEICNFDGVYQARMDDGWNYFNFPEIEGAKGTPNLATGAPDLFLVSADTQYPDEAVDFLKYLTNKENAANLSAAMGFCTCVDGVATEENTNAKVAAAMDDVSQTDGVAEWLDVAMDARVVDTYLQNLQSIFDGKDPAEVMNEVTETAKRVKAESE